ADQMCLQHLLVAGEAEDQRDVDADALGEAVGHGGQTCVGRRDLDQDVGAVDQPVQHTGLGQGAGAVVRETGRDLDRDHAVDSAGGVVDRAQDIGGTPYVGAGEQAQRLCGGGAEVGELGQLAVVGGAL